MEVAGLVLGLVATWKTCIEVFGAIGNSRNYGSDYELSRVRLEVERIRLLAWGDAVGLSEVDIDQSRVDIRLKEAKMRQVVLEVLGGIQQIFEDGDTLQDRYGLIQEIQRPNSPQAGQAAGSLHSVLRKAYSGWRLAGRARQRSASVSQRTIWVIRDRSRFARMVTEIRQCNDSLNNLFPDVAVIDAVRNEIRRIDEIRELALIQEASSEDHADISDIASIRLEELGASGSRSVLSRNSDETARQGTATAGAAADAAMSTEPLRASAGAHAEDDETVVDELEEKLKPAEEMVTKIWSGAVTVSILGPSPYSARVQTFTDWDGYKRERTLDDWNARDKGFLTAEHASFELYHKNKFIRPSDRERRCHSDEDAVLLDPEAHPEYENINAGTITMEGFGLECWDYELAFGKPRKDLIFESTAALPGITAARLLRRLNELGGPSGNFGQDPDRDMLDLQDVLPKSNNIYYDEQYAKGASRWIGELYDQLNRSNFFADFIGESAISKEWASPDGASDFLYQILLGRELGLRLQHFPQNYSMSGFTSRVLANLIISEQWINNVTAVPAPAELPPELKKDVPSPEDQKKADQVKEQGNQAMRAEKYQEAVDLFTQAIEIGGSLSVYCCNRSGAYLCLDRCKEAIVDARAATGLDSRYAKAWSRLGAAYLKVGRLDTAYDAYETAVRIAGSDATPAMHRGLESARSKIAEWNERLEAEEDVKKRHQMASEMEDEQWELHSRTVSFRSTVEGMQLEGLLLFAERMKWPYLNEARDRAENISPVLHSRGTGSSLVLDWYYGLTLPGKWMSFKVMDTLIQCSPTIATESGVAGHYASGVILPKYTYWRVRTALARVLGALPGVRSLCGWVGPCPPVEFVSSPDAPFGSVYGRLKARRVAPLKRSGVTAKHFSTNSRFDRWADISLRPEEEVSRYVAEMTSGDSYLVPQPPVQQVSTVVLKTIQLKKTQDIISNHAWNGVITARLSSEAEYRASVVFSIDNNEAPVSYSLYTNPMFVSLPACRGGPHRIHQRERFRYQMTPWTVERLKDYTPEATEDDDCMVINATGKGAEVLARAWCSERGKNAFVVRHDGPCFVCSIRCAKMMEVGVVIWV